jgi:hypothetical protein
MLNRAGFVHISSMTAVRAAPRPETADVVSFLGDPPWKTHLLVVCSHQSTSPRLKRYEKGGVRALMQCLKCGQKASNFMTVAGVTEQWDSDLEERVRSDYDSARERWEKKRLTAFQSVRERTKSDWWQAYDLYLKSAVWAVKRELVFERCGGVCEACGQRRAEHVHHKKYPEVFGLEPLFDLAGVCIACHKIIHPHME